MINPEFILKQVELTNKASDLLAEGQKELDTLFGGVLKSIKSQDPKKANELKKIMSSSNEIMKHAKTGDFGKIDELIKNLKDGKWKGHKNKEIFDETFDLVIVDLDKNDPERAKKLREHRDQVVKITEAGKKGDFEKMDELTKQLTNER